MEKGHLRKFRLIRKYPTSPKFGTIVREDDGLFVDGELTYFSRNDILSYPEFWRELFQVADGKATKYDNVYAIPKDGESIFGSDFVVGSYEHMISKYSINELYLNYNNLKKKIVESKSKSLIHYVIKAEGKLKDSNTNTILFSINCPKQYWTMVLQEIADDLNEGWKPDWANMDQLKFNIYRNMHDRISLYNQIPSLSLDYGTIVFKDDIMVKKAIEIMGVENLDKIFKS